MSALKSQVGTSSGPYRDAVTAQRISAFCQAIGASPGKDYLAPPTFLTVFRQGEFDLFQKLGIELTRVLHTEQEYLYEAKVKAGDTIRFQTTLTHVLEKQRSSLSMQFLTFETEFHIESGSGEQRAAKSITSIVVR